MNNDSNHVHPSPLPSLSTEERAEALKTIEALKAQALYYLQQQQQAEAERDTLKAERDQLQERFTEQQAATEQTWHGLVAWRSRAEAAEKQLATLQGALKAKAEEWREGATYEAEQNTQYASALDQCADELDALLLHEQRAPETKT